jgi:ABC-type branched-subunit amino acid transport system substrate-binding protein
MYALLLRLRQMDPATRLAVLIGGGIAALVVVGIAGALILGVGKSHKTASSTTTAQSPSPDTSASASAGTTPSPGAGTGTAKKPAAPKTSAGSSNPPAVSTPGADRTGVFAHTFVWGIHYPITTNGVPWHLADKPQRGVYASVDWINKHNGGINGRTVDLKEADDRYTVAGGQAAAKQLVVDDKAFFVSGTLGVDQIAQVANEAKKRGTPYIAGGGSEALFKDIGMYQVASSYDQYLVKLGKFLRQEYDRAGSPYQGKTKVGVSELDSQYISPAVDHFAATIPAPLTVVKRVKVLKPDQQTEYTTQLEALKSAGVQIMVPAQDPLTTSREVAECKAHGCNKDSLISPFEWSAANFAHDGDTDLALMQGEWNGFRVLSNGCYNSAAAYASGTCGAINQAHTEWVAKWGESTGPDGHGWVQEGQDGKAGYQLVHIWLKALTDAGPDLTRERFRAALNNYDNYSDLISSPITYRGSSNVSHGAEKLVIYQAGASSYSQVGAGFTDF